ncbi:MAG: ATP-binding cassette domain-containing protein [Patescibacteria group bacterium]
MIELKDVTKKYGELTAVNNVSLQVAAGEIFAFLGPNGAGKTTTIKMLTTLTRPTAGEITIHNINVVSDPAGVRRTFGIVFQDPSLDNELTAYENMHFHAALYGLSRAQYAERIKLLLELVALTDRQHHFVKTFSGGMKRRLEIARGLLHQPKVLFLDEPTLGLDPQTRQHIWNYVRNLNKTEGVTVFFTTHHMEEVERAAGRLAIIDHGRIVARGTPAEIMQNAKATTLEDAFIALTGHTMREETSDFGKNQMRTTLKMFK